MLKSHTSGTVGYCDGKFFIVAITYWKEIFTFWPWFPGDKVLYCSDSALCCAQVWMVHKSTLSNHSLAIQDKTMQT